MPRALLLLALTSALSITHAAEVFVIADTANQTRTITDAAKETIAEANDIALHLDNDTLANPEDDHEPVVRKKRTFGDVVFRGLADVLGYNVARKPPQIVFPPPLAPVPGIDTPLQAVAYVPVLAAPAVAQAGPPPPCGRAVAPCAPPPPPPPPKPTQPPCPRPRANPKPRPKPRPRPPPPPPPPAPPCAKPRANPTTAAPCTPAAPPPAPAKADSNLETISSNFRLDFNFNRAPASAAPAAAAAIAADEQETEQEQEQIAPVAIQPRAAKLPQDPPHKPRVYLDAFVVRNGVARRVHTVDAQALNRPQADDDYLVYDDEQPQQNQDDDDDYEYVQESRDRAKAVKEFGTAVDRFWEQKQNSKKRLPANDYRNVHFGDRNLANQILQANEKKLQSLQKKRSKSKSIPLPLPKEEEDDEDEITTTTQDPRRPLKPRVLPPTEHNPNQIDTITVRVPPIYKEKRPKKLHRGRTERPDRDEDEEVVESSEEPEENYDSDTENSSPVEQTEPPRRKRRRKNKRRVRSAFKEPYSAGDYDYYGQKIPISKEEEFFRGLTIPPPTKDADLARLEEGKETDAYFLDDHERLREDPERIKTYDRKKKEENDSADEERADESERSDSKERSPQDTERSGENERADETERSDRLSPNAKVRETGYQNQYVRASNVQVDNPSPPVPAVKRKNSKVPKP